MVQYGTSDEVRKRAHNMGTNFYSDDEVDAIMTDFSSNLHLVLGKALTGVDFTATDIEFSTASIYVINATACEMMSSVNVEADDRDRCEKTAQEALDKLQSCGSSFPVVEDHYEINDGLDEDLYMQRDP